MCNGQRVPPRIPHLLAGLAGAILLAGCGRGDDAPRPPAKPAAERPTEREPREAPAEPLLHARCPLDIPGCETASGRIVYVERVDPDGDGDAHFVLVSDESITAPGLTVVDVRADLRPRPLPGIGDELSAAGPVYPGSYGQRQIEAVAVEVAR